MLSEEYGYPFDFCLTWTILSSFFSMEHKQMNSSSGLTHHALWRKALGFLRAASSLLCLQLLKVVPCFPSGQEAFADGL